MTETKRLLLIDGSGYIFRAFFALPPMTRPDGTPINAVFGFCNMLMKLLHDRPHDDLVVVFDAGRKSFRNELYDSYKATREEPPSELVPQFKLVREAARAFDLPVVELENYEADDVIATFAKKAREHGEEVTVVSSDKDLMQLVREGVEMWDPIKQKTIGREEVVERFGVGPELVCDALALIGDTSDNVPGVPGIGPKTAAQLLQEHGSLEGLLSNLDKVKQPKRRNVLAENTDKARLSYRLVCLEDGVPLPFDPAELRRRPIDYPKLAGYFQGNGFRSLVSRIEQEALKLAVTDGEPLTGTQVGAVFETIRDLANLEAVINDALEQGRLTIAARTTSPDVSRAKLVGLGLAVGHGKGYYLPLGHVDEFGSPREDQLDRDEALVRLRPLLADASVLKIGHDMKYAMAVLSRFGLQVTPVEDTMLISYVLDGAKNGHDVPELAKRHLDYDTIPYERLCGRGVNQIGFDKCPVDKAADYAAEDAEVTLRLWQTLKPRLIEERMVTVYETMDRPLAPILAAMELTGIQVDAARLRYLSSAFTQRMAELEEKAYALAGHPFNLGSPKQLGEVLFDEMGLGGPGRKTKTGAYATGAEILEELALTGHELPQVILDWRQLQKLTRTYTDALVEEIDPSSGRVHTCYMMAATSTGRLSSTDPNLQNIPIRTDEGRKIREAFVAEDGYVLMSADYSQIELRVLAHMADIQTLKEAFAKDLDIHAITAAQMFGKEPSEVGPDLRRSAKTINYGIIYGIGAFGLAQRLGIPQAQAKAYIEAYFEQYPGIRDYMEQAKQEAREKGFVRTLFGRRCYVPEINARVPHRRGYAERAAINAPIQGSAADIMRRAMIRVARALSRERSGARMLLQVHDELVFEVPENEVGETKALVSGLMEQAAQMTVPLVVDVGVGRNWEEAH